MLDYVGKQVRKQDKETQGGLWAGDMAHSRQRRPLSFVARGSARRSSLRREIADRKITLKPIKPQVCYNFH